MLRVWKTTFRIATDPCQAQWWKGDDLGVVPIVFCYKKVNSETNKSRNMSVIEIQCLKNINQNK